MTTNNKSHEVWRVNDMRGNVRTVLHVRHADNMNQNSRALTTLLMVFGLAFVAPSDMPTTMTWDKNEFEEQVAEWQEEDVAGM